MQYEKAQQQTPSETVVITGMGLVTPIGSSFWHSMLTLRARRSCYQAHEVVLVADDPTGLTLRGATVSRMPTEILPRECGGTDRLTALLNPAVTECLTTAEWPKNLQLGWEGDFNTEVLDQSLSKKFSKANSPPDVPVLHSDRCYFFAGLAHAAEKLLAGRADGVVVACADSLCDTPRLAELLQEGQLKDAANPYGLMAGEAGGAFLLERESSARRRRARIWGRLATWGVASEPPPDGRNVPSTGRALTEAFHLAFSRLEDAGASVRMIITDENGDRQRALDWAFTAGRIFPNPERERTVRHPAVYTGDTGCAIGAVILADALAQMCWHPAIRHPIALATSDDRGGRRVLCIEPGEHHCRQEVISGIRKHLGCTKNNLSTEP